MSADAAREASEASELFVARLRGVYWGVRETVYERERITHPQGLLGASEAAHDAALLAVAAEGAAALAAPVPAGEVGEVGDALREAKDRLAEVFLLGDRALVGDFQHAVAALIAAARAVLPADEALRVRVLQYTEEQFSDLLDALAVADHIEAEQDAVLALLGLAAPRAGVTTPGGAEP